MNSCRICGHDKKRHHDLDCYECQDNLLNNWCECVGFVEDKK